MSGTGEEPNEVLVTERLEELREQIYLVEKSLSKYGFDPRRGIESYKVSELKALISRSGNGEEVRKLLMKLVELKERLYLELYRQAGLKQINVDTDTPEKRLMAIKVWLATGKTDSERSTRSEPRDVLRGVADALERCGSSNDCKEKIMDLLRASYKRDYDRHRVVKRALELCASYGDAGDHVLENVDATPVDELVDRLVSCAERVGRNKLARLMKVRG